MIRYKLNPNERLVVIVDDTMEKKLDVIYLTKDINYFVDILGAKPGFIKIKLFKPDGDIVIGWITSILTDLIVLHNKDELFDGRFNSSQEINNGE
jgi:hypothetical protein